MDTNANGIIINGQHVALNFDFGTGGPHGTQGQVVIEDRRQAPPTAQNDGTVNHASLPGVRVRIVIEDQPAARPPAAQNDDVAQQRAPPAVPRDLGDRYEAALREFRAQPGSPGAPMAPPPRHLCAAVRDGRTCECYRATRKKSPW